MHGYYGRLVDRVVSPRMERRLRLGRRSDVERRRVDDRRIEAGGDYLDAAPERRKTQGRRSLIERRQRWFRVSQYRSRHI